MIKLQLTGKENGIVYWENEFNTIQEAVNKKKEFSHWEDSNHDLVIVNNID